MISIQTDNSFCGKVPLNQTNLIQPHGKLFIASAESLRILQLSEHAGMLFDLPDEELAGRSLSELLPAAELHEALSRSNPNFEGAYPFYFTYPSGSFLTFVRRSGKQLIFEAGVFDSGARDSALLPMLGELKLVSAAMEACDSPEEVYELAVKELKQISGFDKVMIYRFDENWNGDVIGEAMEPGMQRYLGHKFPESDVPRQVRELYQRVPYRYIPDVTARPLKLYPVLNPESNTLTDLSDAYLRSVSPVHVEYLKNMKVVASMSTRILRQGSLWGLITCHHRSAFSVSYATASFFEWLTDAFSARLSALQILADSRYAASKMGLHNAILERYYREGTMQAPDRDLMDLLSADGVALTCDGNVMLAGSTPEAMQVLDLLMWVRGEEIVKTWVRSNLSAVYEPASEFAAKASGILILPLKPESGMYILAFRTEASADIQWGGNPNEVLHIEPGGTYHPRASFATWKQSVLATSKPWSKPELNAASEFRNAAMEFLLNI